MMIDKNKLSDRLRTALEQHEAKYGTSKPDKWTKGWEQDVLLIQEIMREEKVSGALTLEQYSAITEQYWGNMLCQFLGFSKEHALDATKWLFSQEL